MNYSPESPYFNTNIATDGNYLDVWQYREIPAAASDQIIEISARYHLRPDLLSADLYGSSKFWWVFAVRNPNTLLDPLGDFVSGTLIYAPDSSAIKNLST